MINNSNDEHLCRMGQSVNERNKVNIIQIRTLVQMQAKFMTMALHSNIRACAICNISLFVLKITNYPVLLLRV